MRQNSVITFKIDMHSKSWHSSSIRARAHAQPKFSTAAQSVLVHSQRVNTAAQSVLVHSLKVSSSAQFVLVHRQKVSTATQSLLNDHVQTKTKHSCTIYACAQSKN